jgi:carbonic anhydrase/acetyltransferase-like protein (isoleucine patch superfamily)
MIDKYKDFIPQIHESCYIATNATVIGEVTIGENSSVWFNTTIRGDVDGIKIGNRTNIQDNSVIHCKSGIETVIGDNVTVGHGVILHSCTIEDNCLIGMGAIILDGAKIGSHCIIGAGSLITPNTEIPEGSMVMGSPGKVKRYLTEEEIKHIVNNSKAYIEHANDYK